MGYRGQIIEYSDNRRWGSRGSTVLVWHVRGQGRFFKHFEKSILKMLSMLCQTCNSQICTTRLNKLVWYVSL